jgi:hypothetical protein
MIMGTDYRFDGNNWQHKHAPRNPKFVCDVEELKQKPDCVVYSFGSWDELSFEVGMKDVAPNCEIHIFDPFNPPDPAAVAHYNLHRHVYGVSDKDAGNMRSLQSIMNELGHTKIDVLKIDVEGAEHQALPSIASAGLLDTAIDQIQLEQHKLQTLASHIETLRKHGFEMTYARKEDRCKWCTEVAMQKGPL